MHGQMCGYLPSQRSLPVSQYHIILLGVTGACSDCVCMDGFVVTGTGSHSPVYRAHCHNQQQRPFNGLWSGTTRVGRYHKKHSPTHTHRDHRASFITFLHLQRSMASSLFNLRAWQSSRTTSFQVFFGLPLGLDSEWQWHQLVQVCTLLQTDNHASTPSLSFYRPDALPAAQPTASKHWRQKQKSKKWLKFKNTFERKRERTHTCNHSMAIRSICVWAQAVKNWRIWLEQLLQWPAN